MNEPSGVFSGAQAGFNGAAGFAPVQQSLADLGGISLFVQATAPTGTIPFDSIWIDTANGSLNVWNGSAWVEQTFNATNLIQAGTIIASLIEAGTITATQFAAGIVYAGIVNGTTITSAKFIGDGVGEEVLIYTATPSNGNLICTVSSIDSLDSFNNTVFQGIASYGPHGGAAQLSSNQTTGEPFVILYPAQAIHTVQGPQIYATSLNPGAANEAEVLNLHSGETSSGGFADIQLASQANDGSTVPTMIVNINGSELFIVGPTSSRAAVPIVAADPSNIGLNESWHQAALTNATNSGNNVNGFWYRLFPTGDIELLWDIKPTALSGTLFDLPSGYIPSTAQRLPSGFYGTGPTSYSDTWSPGININTAGAVSLTGLSGGTVGNFVLSGNGLLNLTV